MRLRAMSVANVRLGAHRPPRLEMRRVTWSLRMSEGRNQALKNKDIHMTCLWAYYECL